MIESLQHALNFYSTEFLQALLVPIQGFSLPEKRTFWLFLLSSALLIVWFLFQQKRLTITALRQVFFSKDYWLHKSSQQDILWMFFNSALKLLIIIPIIGSHLAATVFVAAFLQTQVADSPDLNWSPALIMALFTITFFLLEDFSRFSLHRLMHLNPLLWRFHRTHHSAEVLTPFTVYRLHPIEMILYYLRQMLVFGLVSGVFVWLFQGRVSGWAILGVDAAGFLFNFFAANLRHSHIPLSFGIFERWFISPAQHQLHHSKAQEHHDKNFGTCLALWDKLFHSWLPGSPLQKLRFGL